MGGSYSTTSATETTSSLETSLGTPLKPNNDSSRVAEDKEPTVAQPDMSNKSLKTETETKDETTSNRLERLKASYQNLHPLFDAVRLASPPKEWDIVVENVVRMIRSDMEFFRDYDEWFTTSHLPKLNQEAVLPDHFYKPLTDFTLSIYTKPDMFILPPDTLMLEYWLFRYMAYKYRDTYRHPVAELDQDLTCLYAALWRVWSNYDIYKGTELTGKEIYQRDNTLELSCPNKIKLFTISLHELPGSFGHIVDL